jgi:WD40 repeat protein
VIALGATSGYLVLVDLATDKYLFAEKLHDGRVWDLVFSDDGTTLATAGDDGVIRILDWSDLKSGTRGTE